MLTQKIQPGAQRISSSLSLRGDFLFQDRQPQTLLPDQQKLLRCLMETGCVLLGKEAKERYGLNTPIYFDLRAKLYEHPELLWLIGEQLLRVLMVSVGQQRKKQKVIGIPETGIPLALAAALYAWKEERTSNIHFGFLRSREKVYPGGQRESYLGEIDPSAEYTLIDDVIASGTTKLESICRLSEEGCEVKRIVVFVDREQGGTDKICKLGVSVHPVFRLTNVIEFLYCKGYISAAGRLETLDFIKSHKF